MEKTTVSRRSPSVLRLIIGLFAVAALAAACSSDSKNNSTGSSQPGSSSADPLGTPNAATGTPIKIGTITELGSDAIGAQSQQTLDGEQAAVKYVNDYLGGIAGHPIELVACGNKATPEGGQDCANQMVQAGVAAVILPFTAESSAQVPIITAAGIPYIIGAGTTTEDFVTPGAFSVGGGYVGTLAAVAEHGKESGVKKLAHIVIDVPTAVQAAQTIGGLVFKNAGVDYQVVTVAPGTPDMTPQLQTAASGGADAIMVTGDLTFCTSFLKGYETLGLDLKKYVITTCVDPSVISAVPGAFKGAFLTVSIDPTSKDIATYGGILDKYLADKKLDHNPIISGGTAGGVSSVMQFYLFMKGLTGDVTKDTVLKQMQTANAVPTWMGSATSTLTCDGTAIPLLKNVCGAAVQMATLDEKGLPTDFKPIDPSALFKTS